MTYGPFGEADQAAGPRFRYTGQQWLGPLQLYYYKARMYSPGLGRFLQTDPIGYADGLNLYAYVGNDPVNLVDPLGLESAHPGTGNLVDSVQTGIQNWWSVSKAGFQSETIGGALEKFIQGSPIGPEFAIAGAALGSLKGVGTAAKGIEVTDEAIHAALKGSNMKTAQGAISKPAVENYDNENVTGLLTLVAEQTIGNRPGRIEPRAVKRRPKSYPLLTQTRTAAREKIRKYGHPKKLK